MPAPTNAPAWAAELALSYESGAASQFVLFGNVQEPGHVFAIRGPWSTYLG